MYRVFIPVPESCIEITDQAVVRYRLQEGSCYALSYDTISLPDYFSELGVISFDGLERYSIREGISIEQIAKNIQSRDEL